MYVVYSNDDERILVTFYKDNAVSEQYFQINYTDAYFYDTSDAQLNGMAKHEDGYYLQTRVTGDNPGRLYFRDENRPDGQEETEDFRIRVVVDGGYTIRPGDDMQLRFGVAGYPEYDTEVSAGDFMQCMTTNCCGGRSFILMKHLTKMGVIPETMIGMI